MSELCQGSSQYPVRDSTQQNIANNNFRIWKGSGLKLLYELEEKNIKHASSTGEPANVLNVYC